jgi:hypothetical protein
VASGCELSVVITTRNDDFGTEMLPRLQLFVENLLTLGHRHGLSAEVVVVEWNPPLGPRIHEVLKPRFQSERIPVRFIEVPADVHRRYRNSDVLPLFQMIAKNVGIRRARGRFVLCTNQDVLFSSELIAFLASPRLDPGAMYRVSRRDVEAELPFDASVDEQLEWCARHVIRVHRSVGTFPHYRLLWKRGIRSAVGTSGQSYSVERILRGIARLALRGLQRSSSVHSNACGDFTLCSRDRWMELRGYAELPLYSLHLDALFCHAAVAAGARQVLLRSPLRCYHVEHEGSWSVMNTEEKLRWFAEKPWLDTTLLREAQEAMHRTGKPAAINGPDWGLRDLELREVTLLGGGIE